MEKEIKKKVKAWVYRYDNYPTMMVTKKNFEKGNMARELAEELLKFIESKEELQ